MCVYGVKGWGLGCCFLQDAGLCLSEERKEPFLELHRILEALKLHELGPALQ